MFRKQKQFEVEVEIEATDPGALLDHATPEGVWLRCKEGVYGSAYFPLMVVAGDLSAVRAFIMDHWGATAVNADGTVEWDEPF